jgi:hypothetical protein
VDTGSLAATRLSRPTECAVVTQASDTGALQSNVLQADHSDTDARSNAAITQHQGTFNNGLDFGVDQDTAGLANSAYDGHEDFHHVGHTQPGLLTQIQHGPMYGNGTPGPNQCCNPNDTATFRQISNLKADGAQSGAVSTDDEGGDFIEQDSVGGIQYFTLGTAFALQDFSTNDGHFQQTQQGSVVHAETTCGDVEIPEFVAAAQPAEPPPNTCVGTGFGAPPPTDTIPTDTIG